MLRLHFGCALSQKSYLRKDRIKFATHNYFSIFFVVLCFSLFGCLSLIFYLSGNYIPFLRMLPMCLPSALFLALLPAFVFIRLLDGCESSALSLILHSWRVSTWSIGMMKSPFYARVGVILDLFSPFFGLFFVKMLGFCLVFRAKSLFYGRRIVI